MCYLKFDSHKDLQMNNFGQIKKTESALQVSLESDIKPFGLSAHYKHVQNMWL